jgi:hypothetical protein
VEIDFQTGYQRRPPTPNDTIPKTDTGAFTLALTRRSPGIGKCRNARITFDTTAGSVSTQPFQMVPSRE